MENHWTYQDSHHANADKEFVEEIGFDMEIDLAKAGLLLNEAKQSEEHDAAFSDENPDLSEEDFDESYCDCTDDLGYEDFYSQVFGEDNEEYENDFDQDPWSHSSHEGLMENYSKDFDDLNESIDVMLHADDGFDGDIEGSFFAELTEDDVKGVDIPREDIWDDDERYEPATSFDGADLADDIGRLNECLSAFEVRNWKQLSFDERKDKVIGLCNYIANRALKLKQPPDVKFKGMSENVYGEYKISWNWLEINRGLFDQLHYDGLDDREIENEVVGLLTTIGHENWHAYQNQRIKDHPFSWKSHRDNKYFENLEKADEDEEFYAKQKTEHEAEAFGSWLAGCYKLALKRC